MKKIIKLKGSDLKTIIKRVLNEETDLDEYGIKGMRKDDTYLWDDGDQMLAMYNAEYGIEDLHITKQDVVNEIIGSTVGSLAKQTSNFNFLAGRGGLDRPNKMQSLVYEKFKGVDKNDFRRICLKLIEDRYQNPTERVKKRKLGKVVGGHREDIVKSREDALRDQGVNPAHATMIGQRPKFDPVVDEPDEIEVPQSPRKNTPKDEIGDFLRKMYAKVVETNPELADDIQFISDYIDSELIDKEMLSEIKTALMGNKFLTENKNIIKVKESDIKNIVEKIIMEHSNGDLENDYIQDNEEQNEVKNQITEIVNHFTSETMIHGVAQSYIKEKNIEKLINELTYFFERLT